MSTNLRKHTFSVSTAVLYLVNDSPSQIRYMQTKEPAGPALYSLLTEASVPQAATWSLVEAEVSTLYLLWQDWTVSGEYQVWILGYIVIWQHLIADKPVNGLQKDNKSCASSNTKAAAERKKSVLEKGTGNRLSKLSQILVILGGFLCVISVLSQKPTQFSANPVFSQSNADLCYDPILGRKVYTLKIH